LDPVQKKTEPILISGGPEGQNGKKKAVSCTWVSNKAYFTDNARKTGGHCNKMRTPAPRKFSQMGGAHLRTKGGLEGKKNRGLWLGLQTPQPGGCNPNINRPKKPDSDKTMVRDAVVPGAVKTGLRGKKGTKPAAESLGQRKSF